MELLVLLLIIFLIAAAVGRLGRGYYRRPVRPVYDDEVVYEEPVPRRRRWF
jgi:hypothetical protein